MKQIPISYLLDIEYCGPDVRSFLFHEYACNGAKHVVLTDTMIFEIMKRRSLAKELESEIAAEGLDFVDSHAPFGAMQDLNCNDKSFRHEMVLRHKLAINIAASMGVKTITIHVGNYNDPNVPTQVYQDNIVDALEKLLPEAEKCGIIIAIENIYDEISNPDILLAVKEKFPTDWLGFCYDAGHANIQAKGFCNPKGYIWTVWPHHKEPRWDDKVLEKMLPHVVTCHLHDNDGDDDQHLAPGGGNIDWKHIMGLLAQAPRLKCLQNEAIPIMKHVSIRDICQSMKDLEPLTSGVKFV